ncbi:cell surface protein [Tamlana fucoidanivorans]|uniref:Cell surface protein n=1 Tax=Allotamlana fucoidanivorans TaxID=2583814 RepID=A0A5C4SKA8_9FLAO|nr:DUF5074 domain-containing protein [Tamlana fucoidanivorans]TNJ43461.1 cell surface protein [Tamlana fucoidanivorans]
MKLSKLIFKLFILSLLLLQSCSQDDDDTVFPKGDYENGILVSGEGSGAGTGSISFIANDFSDSENLIYKKVNGTELGTFLQSMAFSKAKAFIVVDNSNTITVVDRYTFKKEGEITTGLATPRFLTVVGDKAYVTNWGAAVDETDDFVAVIDLNSLQLIKTISVSNGPERIIEKDGKLFVSHKGAYTNNNVISVISINDDSVKEIVVKDRPDELFFSDSGALVVLSEGRTLYDASWNVTGHTQAGISMINTSSLSVDLELTFEEGEHPSLMVYEDDMIYYALNGAIFKMNAEATALPSSSILTAEGYLYAMEVEDNRIYATNTSFSDVSTLNIYDVTTQEKIDSKEVALGASKIYFN